MEVLDWIVSANISADCAELMLASEWPVDANMKERFGAILFSSFSLDVESQFGVQVISINIIVVKDLMETQDSIVVSLP